MHNLTLILLTGLTGLTVACAPRLVNTLQADYNVSIQCASLDCSRLFKSYPTPYKKPYIDHTDGSNVDECILPL